MEETGFAEVEKQQLEKFREEAERRLLQGGVTADLSMFSLTNSVGIDLTLLAKEGPLMVALWVTLLSTMRNYYKFENFKYPTIESFLEAYEGKFIGESEQELANLWHTANWMNVLFTLIPARKNKGLVMQVIPKVVEGWEAKYVTGSGQTRFTANRVHVFESEGNTRANHRGKHRMGAKKRHDPNNISRSIQRNIAAEYKSPRRRKRGGRVGVGAKGFHKRARSEDDSSFDEEHDLHLDETDGDEEDEDDDNEERDDKNAEMVMAYTLFRDTSGLGTGGHQALGHLGYDADATMMDVSSVFGESEENVGDAAIVDLMRSDSILNLKCQNSLTIQREVSWTEIPVKESSSENNGSVYSQPSCYSQGSFGLLSPHAAGLSMDSNTFTTNTPIPMNQGFQPPYYHPHYMMPMWQTPAVSNELCYNPPCTPAAETLEPRAVDSMFRGWYNYGQAPAYPMSPMPVNMNMNMNMNMNPMPMNMPMNMNCQRWQGAPV